MKQLKTSHEWTDGDVSLLKHISPDEMLELAKTINKIKAARVS